MYGKDFYDKMMEMHTDLKHMVKWAEDHDETDNNRFKETNAKVDWVTKIAWVGIGGLGMLQLFIHFIK